MKNLQTIKIVKAHANGRNKSQHCCVFVGQQCCVRLYGSKRLTDSNYTQHVPTSANIVVVQCKRTQHVVLNNVACCWPTMLRPFALALKLDNDEVYHYLGTQD